MKEGETIRKEGEHENQHWLDNWLRLKVQQEQKEFNEITKKEAKQKIRSMAFVQLGLKGKVVIEDFPELTQLNLSNNDLEEIIIRNCPDLKLVSLGHNQLTKLKIENCPSVKELYTSFNQLTSLEEAKIEESNNLLILSYDQNPLTVEEKDRLDAFGLKDTAAKAKVYGPAQEWLDAKYPLDVRDSIEKLDISELGLQGKLNLEGFTNLKQLDCSGNELTELELGDCEKLESLDCSNNEHIEEKEVVKRKRVNGKLTRVTQKEKFRVGITSLNASNNKKLQDVHANHCLIKKINLIGLVELKCLSISHNNLLTLNLTGLNKLETLVCSNNEIQELDLKVLEHEEEYEEEGIKKTRLTTNLKHLICDNNYIEKLEIKNLHNLESLYCFKCYLPELDCSGLKNLKELYCAHNLRFNGGYRISKLNVDGCNLLEELDCAENGLFELNLSGLPNLVEVSTKENQLKELVIKDCENLEYLDFSRQKEDWENWKESANSKTRLVINSSLDRLEEVFYDETAIVPNWEQFPNLELVGIGEERLVEEEGKQVRRYFVEETDFLAIRNTKNIQNILANPKNYSFADLSELKGKKLHGVSTELKERLVELIIKKANEELLRKLRKQFFDEDKKTPPQEDPEDSGEEENPNSNPPTEIPTPTRTPTPQQTPVPKDNSDKDKDQLVDDLKERIAKLEEEVENLKNENKKPTTSHQRTKKIEEVEKEIEKTKKEINNSKLSKEQKEKLLKLLEDLAKKNKVYIDNEAESPSSSHNYNSVLIPVLIVEFVLLSALIYAYWHDWKRAAKKKN